MSHERAITAARFLEPDHGQTPPSASARRPPDRPGRPAGSGRCSRSARRRAGPRLELGARPLEAVVLVAQLARRQVSQLTLYSTLGVVRTTVAAGRTRTPPARSAASRGGSRCSITSTTAAASKPSRPLVAIGQRAVHSSMRSRCAPAVAPDAVARRRSPARGARRPRPRSA